MKWLDKILEFFDLNDVDKTVTVKKGDSLWRIAEAITGQGSRWHELAEANPGRWTDSDFVIQPGETLKLPKSWCAK